MDHQYIQEQQIISLYLMRKIAPEDRVDFEDHLVDCRQCLDELELTDDFRRTLQHVVAENGSRASAPQPPVTRLSAFGAQRRTALLTAAALALAGFAVLLFVGQGRRFGRELERMRTASADWERRYRNEEQVRQVAESKLRDALAQAAAPLFTLNLTRSAASDAAEAANTVLLSPSAKSIVLSVEWQNDPEFQTYRALLTAETGRSVWSDDYIPSPTSGTLAITLPASLFQPGNYLLTVEGKKAGNNSVLGRYRFRVALFK
jgi:hypothetical protein